MTKSKVMCVAAAALAASCLWSATAWSAAEDGQFAVKGIGVRSCGDFSRDYTEKSQNNLIFAGWLDGYITALNRLQPSKFDAAPWQSTSLLLAMISNHCAANPDERLFSVVHALLGFFSNQSLKATSPSIEVKAGENKLSLYRDVLRMAQEALVAAGDYTGTPDGVFGPKTRAAFEAFQERNGLTKSGLPSQETLYRLLGPNKSAN